MNPSRFRPNQLRKRIQIGGNQLRQCAVLQDFLHERIIRRKAFQHVRCGRVSCLCFLSRRHAHFLKQDMSELLRGVHIEGLSRFLVNGAEVLLFPGSHIFPHFLPADLIGGNARLFHTGQDRRQRRFNGFEELCHITLFQLFPGCPVYLFQESRRNRTPGCLILRFFRINRVSTEYFRHKSQGIGHTGRVHQVRRKRQVKEGNVFAGESAFPELFAVLHSHCRSCGKSLCRTFCFVCMHFPVPAAAGNHRGFPVIEGSFSGQSQRKGTGFAAQVFLPCPALCFHLFLCLPGLCQFFKTGKGTEFRSQLFKAELPEQSGHFFGMYRAVHILQKSLYGYIPADPGQSLRQIGHISAGADFLTQLALDLFSMRIEFLQRAVLCEQLQGCLFSHAGNPGNIIRRIAHERLHIHHLRRNDTVRCLYRFRSHFRHFRNALPGKKDSGAVIDQLQRIPVSGDDFYRQFSFIPGRQRPQDIIAFIPGQFVLRNAHHPKDIANQSELGHQLCRGRLSCPLVILIDLHTECILILIEGHRHVFRVQAAVHAEEHPQESVHRIGIHTVFRQQRQRIKRAVEQAVAVNEHQFLFQKSLLKINKNYLYYTIYKNFAETRYLPLRQIRL